MLTIRLQRTGRTKMPLYRLVLAEKTAHVSKNAKEILGHYNPRTKELVVNESLLSKWLGLNIECSDTAHNLLVRKGLLKKELRIPQFKTKKAKGKTKA